MIGSASDTHRNGKMQISKDKPTCFGYAVLLTHTPFDKSMGMEWVYC